jgi:ribosomal protein S18 acetylase RimI-like enzyme
MTEQLLEEGARDVVLDVRAENLPALAAYAGLGYGCWGTFLGGPADAVL